MQRLPHSLTAVRAFDAAARHMSCSRAAEELFLTQSAVSKQLLSLEENLGIQLFVRVHQGLALTDAGAAYWEAVRPALVLLADATAKARALRMDENTVHLIVPPALCQKWLIPRLVDFSDKNPTTKLQFVPRTASESAQNIFTAEIRGECQMPHGAPGRYLLGQDFYIICSPGLARTIPITSAISLLRQPLLEHTRLPHMWNRWFACHHVTGYDPRGTQRFENFSVMIPALVAGMGVALMPRCLVEEELRQGTLCVLFAHPMRTEYGYYLLPSKNHQSSAALNGFVDWLVAKCEEYPG